MNSSTPPSSSIEDVLRRNIIFVGGKGGVGKTSVSEGIAQALSERGRKVLWAVFEDPLRPPGELKRINPRLSYLNCESTTAFEEYMHLKIGVATISRIFLQNKLIQYLAKAAPGLHELVLMGKVWHERNYYDHVVVDMPATGHGLAMFQSIENFARLFQGGPLHKDAKEMMITFGDPRLTGYLIVALPEEMPLREALELNQFLYRLFPSNPAAFLVNRRFPHVRPKVQDEEALEPATEPAETSPVPRTASEYALRRSLLELHNLRLWRQENISFAELGYVSPPAHRPDMPHSVSRDLARQLIERNYA